MHALRRFSNKSQPLIAFSFSRRIEISITDCHSCLLIEYPSKLLGACLHDCAFAFSLVLLAFVFMIARVCLSLPLKMHPSRRRQRGTKIQLDPLTNIEAKSVAALKTFDAAMSPCANFIAIHSANVQAFFFDVSGEFPGKGIEGKREEKSADSASLNGPRT